MSDLAIILIFVAAPAAVLGLVLLRGKVAKAATQAKRAVSTCGEVAHPGGTLDPQAWFIGPDLTGRGEGPEWSNKSPGMPLHPEPHPQGGFIIRFPTDPGSKVDYVTFRHGPLTGKSRFVIDYTLTLGDGVEVLAVPEQDGGHYRAQMTPIIVREGDDWTTAGVFEAYRWFFGGDLHYLEAGDRTCIASLEGPGWGGTQTSTFATNPAGFQAAKDNACCIGFVFGGNDIGIGHGARAVGTIPGVLVEAVLWVKSVRVE